RRKELVSKGLAEFLEMSRGFVLRKSLPGMREPITMYPTTLKTKNHVVRFDVFSNEYSIQRNETDCRPCELKALPGPYSLKNLPDLGNLPAGNSDPRSERPLLQPL